MSSTEEIGWQELKKTVVSKTEFLFKNDLMSDVIFDFGENKIPAHKLILSMGSSVFFTMFYGSMSGEKIIRINDVSVEAFTELLRYIYAEKVYLNLNNIAEMIYLAKKFLNKFLQEECFKFMKSNLKIETVCAILQLSVLYESFSLTNDCLDLIKTKTMEVLLDESFLEVDHKIFKLIFNINEISCSELDMFDAAKKWAINRCKEDDVRPNGKNIRRQLGDLFYSIRFHTMSPKSFTQCVGDDDLFSDEEIAVLIRQISNKNYQKSKFYGEARGFSLEDIYERECLLNFKISKLSQVLSYEPYHTTFSVNKEIWLTGFKIVNQNTHILTDSIDENLLVEIRLIKNINEIMVKMETELKIFDKSQIFFDRPIKIEPNFNYTTEIMYSRECTITSNEQPSYCEKIGSVEFNFKEISGHILKILFKKL